MRPGKNLLLVNGERQATQGLAVANVLTVYCQYRLVSDQMMIHLVQRATIYSQRETAGNQPYHLSKKAILPAITKHSVHYHRPYVTIVICRLHDS